MAVVQLASVTDVQSALGRNLTSDEAARVDAILDKASELFRRRSGQTFTPSTSQNRLKVNGGQVRLPQRPVVSVESVVDDDGFNVTYTRFQSVLTVDDLTSSDFITVAYTHGGAVPDIVRLCIAEIAKKVLSIDPTAATGIVQHTESTGPFSVSDTYATWAQGGQTMLAPDDDRLALSFKIPTGSVIVQSY